MPSATKTRDLWSTMPSSQPGVRREGRRFVARVCFGGRWLYLGLYLTEWEAGRVSRLARERKLAGLPLLPVTDWYG